MLINKFLIYRSLFQEVENNSLTVWKWEMYRLVDEFDQQPGLAPPLILFEDIWMLFRLGYKKCCCREEREEADESYMKEANDVLADFERACMTMYVDTEHKQAEESIDEKLQKEKRIE